MSWLYIVLFSFIQGVTEFLPVSSSAHLLALPYILGIEDQGVVVDVCAHIGSLLAVLFVFRRDILDMAADFFRWKKSSSFDLVFKIALATVPITLFAGAVFFLDINMFRNPLIPIFTLFAFGILLWAADARFKGKKDMGKLSFKDALFIGCGQAIAIIPGVSRSGICLTGGIVRGMTRQAAVKFAFLLSIPSIMLAGAGAAFEYIRAPEPAASTVQLLAIILLSFVFSLGAIRFMLAWISRFSFKAFAIYRVAFAIVLASLLLW